MVRCMDLEPIDMERQLHRLRMHPNSKSLAEIDGWYRNQDIAKHGCFKTDTNFGYRTIYQCQLGVLNVAEQNWYSPTPPIVEKCLA